MKPTKLIQLDQNLNKALLAAKALTIKEVRTLTGKEIYNVSMSLEMLMSFLEGLKTVRPDFDKDVINADIKELLDFRLKLLKDEPTAAKMIQFIAA